MRLGSKAPGAPRRAARGLLRELPSFLKLLYRLVRDARVPRADKLLLALATAYVLAPADLVPDVLGVFGLVDDLYLLGLVLGRLLDRAGPDVLLEHWDGNPRALGYLVEGVDQLGAMLPAPIRRALHRTAAEPEDAEDAEDTPEPAPDDVALEPRRSRRRARDA
jgi:uncharacterized membrane protein YkvA (DUF1232 family)